MKKNVPQFRVLIADDHALFRQGLRGLIQAEEDLNVIGEAGDGEETVKLAQQLQPDMLLLDVAMPGLSGLEVLRELSDSPSRPMRIILLTATITKEQIVQALQLGAHGVVLKESATQVLLKSIRTVMGGEFWVGRDSVADLVQYMRGLAPFSSRNEPEKALGLTPRELEIVAAIVAGYTNKEIARKFSLSQDTVKHHLTNIFNKLGVSNRLELAVAAIHIKTVQKF